jgi:hypothetical protein
MEGGNAAKEVPDRYSNLSDIINIATMMKRQ